MPACPKCAERIRDPLAIYCAHCGALLPDPRAKRRVHGPGIRGLLILPAIAVCLVPVMNLLLIWSGLDGQGQSLMHAIFRTTDASFNLDLYAKTSKITLLIFSLLVAVLFFARKSAAPRACLALFGLYSLDNLVLALWMQNVPFIRYEAGSMMTAKFLFWGVLAYFWWGYISVSERVRATFVK